MTDKFFTQTDCDRCGEHIGQVRTCSWFTDECICSTCHKKETTLKSKLREVGVNTALLEGCGYIPKLNLEEK